MIDYSDLRKKALEQSLVPDLTIRINRLEAENQRLRRIIAVAKDVLENVASNYDHDADAHKYGTPCRECQTRNALDEIAKIEKG